MSESVRLTEHLAIQDWSPKSVRFEGLHCIEDTFPVRIGFNLPDSVGLHCAPELRTPL